MSGGEIERVTPTLAVGIGDAGCKMISALHDLTREEGINEKFRFVGIDTNESDLSANIDYSASEVTKIELEPPERWGQNKQNYDYINSNVLPGGERILTRGGARRERVIGRYYVDSHKNFNDLQVDLRTIVDEFGGTFEEHIDKEGNKMNIWVMNSLGGGTGSGSFPIVAAMLLEITREANFAVGKYNIFGVGALPSADRLSRDHPNFHLNTYAALRDLQVLLGEDEHASCKIRLGEERAGIDNDDTFDFDYVFDRYFLQPFDQEEMSDAYKYQLNKTSASLPLYFALIEGLENWFVGHTASDDRLYTFDTYEFGAPVEDIYRYFATDERISRLKSELDDLKNEKRRVTNDLEYLRAVSQVDIEEYIHEYSAEREMDEIEVEMRNINIVEEFDLPEKVVTDMVIRARNFAAGRSYVELSRDELDTLIEETYDPEWDEYTKTADVDNSEVWEYIVYQMVARQVTEEQRSHRLHELIESKWKKYRNELRNDFGHLDNEGASVKWRDGLQRFFNQRIRETKRELPTGALYAAGLSFVVTVILLYAHLTNLAAIAALSERSVTLATVTASLTQIVIGIAVLATIGFGGFYGSRYWVLSSLKDEREMCESAYSEYDYLEQINEAMHDGMERIDLGTAQLSQRKDELNEEIDETEEILEQYEEIQRKTVERLSEFKIELDRKLALPIAEEKLTTSIKNTVREYIHQHPSINLEVMNREIFDIDSEMEVEILSDDEASDTSRGGQDSLARFIESEIIKEATVSEALNDILDSFDECPITDRAERKPDLVSILTYLWNSTNSSITDSEGGGESYAQLTSGFDYVGPTDKPVGEITDEFKVWIMGIYTNFHLENAAEYIDIDDLYAEYADGDTRVTEHFNLDAGANYVTKRFAYPEFYMTDDHPLNDKLRKYLDAEVPST